MILTNIYAWALASLPGSQNNDFASAAGYLVAAASNLIINTPLNQAYIDTKPLPEYLASSGGGVPWGTRTVSNTNPLSQESIPQTGVTRKYEFTIARGIIAPDGFNKSAILVNNRYPGPMIEANWGDEIELLIHNQISSPEEGTTIHFHGLSQYGTPWYDGTPGLSQCPVAPGSSYTYKFRADHYGTSWYHSHLSAQYTDGLYGPVVIHGPSSAKYDIDVGPVMIHDYYRQNSRQILRNSDSPDFLTALLNPADNMLIHGGENFVCAIGSKCDPSNAGLPGFTFQPGKRHLLRLISPASLATPILFSIDNHTMTVISNDFTPITPYSTDVIQLGPGQRSDIIVDATGAAGQSFWMRIRQPTFCGYTLQGFGLGAVYYTPSAATGATRFPDTTPNSDFNKPVENNCINDPLNKTVPSYPIPAAKQPDKVVTITSNLGLNATGSTIYFMNNKQYIPDFNRPLLGVVANGNASTVYDARYNAYDIGDAKTVWLVFNNNMSFAHVMHFHGQQFQVLAEGQGAWDGKTITNPQNPQRRDGQIVQANGYAVMQLSGTNAGVWPFHCHLAWHLSSGMIANFIFQPDVLRKEKNQINSILAKSCKT